MVEILAMLFIVFGGLFLWTVATIVVFSCGGRKPQRIAAFAASALASSVVSGLASLGGWGLVIWSGRQLSEPPALTEALIFFAPVLASLSGLLCLISGIRGERKKAALVSLAIQLLVLGGPLAVALHAKLQGA
jgi:hypothetical protein